MKKILFLISTCIFFNLLSQETVELDLAEPSDVNTLLESETTSPEPTESPEIESDISTATMEDLPLTLNKELEKSDLEPQAEDMVNDDLKSISEDTKELKENEDKKNEIIKKEEVKKTTLFDIGNEEKKLLELSKFVQTKLTNKEWQVIAKQAKNEKYVVQEGEWLWQISKKLFGTGFYYSKIWSMNPYIKNPHEIKPGMVLIFDTGDEDNLPDIKVGSFEETKAKGVSKGSGENFDDFGEDVESKWISDRKRLIEQGLYFQYASDETYDDLSQLGKISLVREWEKYDPPIAEIVIKEPGEQYDRAGFDKNSKIVFSYKEGFFLNTFITNNIVEDLGKISALPKARELVHKFDEIFVEFDEMVKPKPGDKFSIYQQEGKISHKVSDRHGFRFTITAQIEVSKKIGDKWLCKVLEITDLVKRGDRVTVYTPKIEKIRQTFTNRKIEAAIIGSFSETVGALSFGNVVYLDRGRADGVELGNVFETYSFIDEGSGKKITSEPSFKTGELTVVTLTENFSTALITLSGQEISLGTLAYSKTLESISADKKGNKDHDSILNESELDNLDIEMNLDDVSEDLLGDADSIKLTDDELEELEGAEREKSIINEHEKDLKELEKLETQILDAEAKIYEERKDQDKYLEDLNLQDLEFGKTPKEPTLENLDDIEKEIGLKYIDQNIEIKENPYGLTEFDLEEIDRLLNTEVK